MALADNALTLASTLAGRLNLSVSSTSTPTLESLVSAASAIVSRFCSREFYHQSANVQKVEGTPGPKMLVPDAPINSITSITYDGSTVDSSSYEIFGDGKSGIIYNKYGSWIDTAWSHADISRTRIAGSSRKLYTVTYDSGWVTPQQSTAASPRTLPYDVEEAVLAIAVAIYRSRGRDQSIVAEKLMNASVQYANPGMARNETVTWVNTHVPMAALILGSYQLGNLLY